MQFDKSGKNKKSLLIVYVSLFLALILFSTATFSWFTFFDTATIESDELIMNASTGLRVNEGEEITNIISIDGAVLSEVSSVDGRNIFLPVTGSYSSDTYDMLFREASIGDQNEFFAYKSFTLTGDSDVTSIYVKSYDIEVTDKNKNTYKYNGGTEIVYNSDGIPISQVSKVECPVRIAFITDSADPPTVIDPTALVDAHVTNYNAVKSITSTGYASTEKTDYKSFSNHFYSYNNALFVLHGSESKNVTMVVWLEGTADSNVSDKFANATVSVDVELESNFTDTEIIYFVDDTIGDDDATVKHWIKGDKSDCIVTMAYYDKSDNTTKTIVMNELSNTQWFAYIPKGITSNIYFYRYSLTDEVIYNAWYTNAGVNNATSDTVKGWLENDYSSYGALQTDRGTASTYTALRGNGHGDVKDTDSQLQLKRLSPCIGFWDYTGSSGGSGSGGDNTGGGSSTKPMVNITLSVIIPTPEKEWIQKNLRDNSYDMYAIIETDGVEAEYKLYTDPSNYDRCSKDGIHLKNGSKLVRFELKSSYGHVKQLPFESGVGPVILNKNHNYNFKINQNDKVINF